MMLELEPKIDDDVFNHWIKILKITVLFPRMDNSELLMLLDSEQQLKGKAEFE